MAMPAVPASRLADSSEDDDAGGGVPEVVAPTRDQHGQGFPLYSFLRCCPAFVVAFTGGFLVSSLDATQTQVQVSFRFCGDDGFNCKSGEFRIAYIQTALFVGAILGALACRFIAERGRKLLLCCVSFFVIPGSVLAGLAPDGHSFGAVDLWWLLIVGRAISGVGMGMVCVSVPLFVSEVTPNAWRGNFNSLQFLMQSVGSFAAVVLSLAVQQPPGSPGYTNGAFDGWWWRVLLLIPAFPLSVASLLALSFIDETPYCLIKRGSDDRALAFLTRVHGDEVGRREYEASVFSVRQRERHVREVRRSKSPCATGNARGRIPKVHADNGARPDTAGHGRAVPAAHGAERRGIPPRAAGRHRARRPAEPERRALAPDELVEDLRAGGLQRHRRQLSDGRPAGRAHPRRIPLVGTLAHDCPPTTPSSSHA